MIPVGKRATWRVAAACALVLGVCLPSAAGASPDSGGAPFLAGPVMQGATTAVATGKSFRAAPQNGNNVIIVAYSCDVTGLINTAIPVCSVTTDLGDSADRSQPPRPGSYATSTGTLRLQGNTATICVQGASGSDIADFGITPVVCTVLA